MSHTVRHHLRLDVAEYDRIIRQFIPGYERMLAGAADAVAAAEPELVLDLGAGTAALSEQVLERTTDAVVDLWDVDPEMLEQARARLERFGARARPALRSYLGTFPDCDAIMASLSLHHIPDPARKQTLYGRAYAAIRPGGVLVIADVTMPADLEARQERFQEWAAHMADHGITEARARQHFGEWAEEDTYLPLEVEVASLEAVGFQVSVPWRQVASTLIVADRPRAAYAISPFTRAHSPAM